MQLFGSVDSDYISGSEYGLRQKYIEQHNERYDLAEVCMYLDKFVKNILKHALEEEYSIDEYKASRTRLKEAISRFYQHEHMSQEIEKIKEILEYGKYLFDVMEEYHQEQCQCDGSFMYVKARTREVYFCFKSTLELFYQDLFNLGEENEYLLQRLADKLGLKSAIYWTDEQMYQAKQQYLPAQQKHISMRKQQMIPTRFTVKHIILTGRGKDRDRVLYVE